jgi:hypothetical protein
MNATFATDPALGTDPAAQSSAGSFWNYLNQGATAATNILTAIKGGKSTATTPTPPANAAQVPAGQNKVLVYVGLAVAGVLAVGLFIVALTRTKG